MALLRQSDCSLSMYNGTYMFSLTPPTQISLQVLGITPNIEKALHKAAGLTTQSNVFASGCSEATLGIGSRRAVFLGTTAQKSNFYAASGYDRAKSSNVLYTGTLNPTTYEVRSFNSDASQPGIVNVAAGDLNGDGLADIVGIDGKSASISVWLSKTDGTVGTATAYPLPGTSTTAVVLADFNGDGKVDVIVATIDAAYQERISILTGKGDGTLNTAVTFPVTSPTVVGFSASPYIHNLIATDLRGTGRKDIVGSNGIVLLNNGNGTFTQGTQAFAPPAATSLYAPNLVAGDFNKDGKPDVAVDNGAVISIYLGKGDGTFTRGMSYASINDVGYLTASDLDGDGNLDLYVGLANGGVFGGDQYGGGKAYALMGNGDGTFQGAPVLPFVYTGNNLGDLNGDKIMDAVGVNADLSFTSYLGDSKGGFTAKSTLVTSPVTLGGVKYSLSNIDSFAIGDVNGDSKADLVYIAPIANQPPGVFIALGDGNGGFAAPVFYAAPSFLAPGELEYSPLITSLRLADLNHDGKADLIYSYSDTNYKTNVYTVGTAVQLGNGDNTFQLAHLIPYYSGAPGFFRTSKVALISDLNKDGNPDLIFLTETATRDSTLSAFVADLQVALGKGDGSFSTPTKIAGPDIMRQIQAGTQYAPINIADMNGDGIPDIIALGSSSNYNLQVAVSLGNGDGTFKAPLLKTYAAQALTDQGLAVADFDGDGKADVAVSDPFNTTDSGISFGNGDGTLRANGTNTAALPNLGIFLQVGGATVALDVNGDGKPDIISGSVELLAQNASSGGGGTADFAVAASATSGTVTAGTSATATLTLTPSNGFTQSVSLSCSGLPTLASCSFSPATVTLASGAASSTLSITTTAKTALNLRADPQNLLLPSVLLAGFGFGLPLALRHRRRDLPRSRLILLLMLLLSGFAVLHGCGGTHSSGAPKGPPMGSPGTPAGTYMVTVSATAGSLVHSVPFTLTVN